MPVTFTTDLPDASGLELDASVEDELTATWTDVLNNGEYHLELRDDQPDGSGAYQDEATVGEATASHTITGLLDGEQYSVRLRTQTAYKTGAWLAAEDITKMPAPDGLSFTNVAETSLTATWNDNADFDGSYQIYRARAAWDTTITDDRWLVGTVADTTESYDDADVVPGTEYEYLVRAQTSWVYADTSIQTVTTGGGHSRTRVPAQGWYVEVDHPSGTTLQPSVLDDAQVVPKVNGLPRVRIPVTKSTKWQADAFEKAAVRVWHDGERQPAEVLLDVEQQPGRSVLVARGGEALRERVEAEYDNVPVHDVAAELIDQHTDYATNIDAPDVGEFTETALDADTASEIVDALDRDASTPFTDRDGDLQLSQTAHVYNCGDTNQVSYSGGTDDRADDYTGGFGRALSSAGDTVTTNRLTLEHEIPAGEVGIATRWAWDSTPADIQIRVVDADDGSVAGSITMTPIDDTISVTWDFDDTGTVGDPWDSGAIPAGTYQLEIEAQESVSGATIVDTICLFDRRYYDTSADFDNTVHEAEGHLDAPELFPAEASVWSDAIPTVLSVIGGTVDITIDDMTGNQALGVTNDGQDALVTASNTDSVTADFGSRTGEIQAQLTLSATDGGARDATPRYGYQSQRVSTLTITGEFDDMPLVLNRQFDDRLVNVLRELAGQLADSVFAVDVQDDGTGVVEWAQREQRTTTVNASLADFEIVTTRDPLEAAIVYGSNQTVRREAVDVTHGTAVALEHARLAEGSIDVYDPETSESFERGDDFELSHSDGTITALADGELVDGATYRVDYEFQTRGEYVVDGVASVDAASNVEVTDVSGLTTDRACGQAARRIVETGKQPRHELSATWPADADLPPATDALLVDGLPVDTAIQTTQIERTPAEIVTTGGSRRPVEDVIQEIDERFSSLSRRV
jgi:hypothetical protein